MEFYREGLNTRQKYIDLDRGYIVVYIMVIKY